MVTTRHSSSSWVGIFSCHSEMKIMGYAAGEEVCFLPTTLSEVELGTDAVGEVG